MNFLLIHKVLEFEFHRIGEWEITAKVSDEGKTGYWPKIQDGNALFNERVSE